MGYWNMIKQILVIALFGFGSVNASAQAFDPFIQDQVDALNYDSLHARLQTFESMGIKTAGSDALDNTRDWIVDLYQQWGYEDIAMDAFDYGSSEVANIIVTKTGSVYPDTYLIVDGHYDTYGGPGVNDNGSGTAIVLEVARQMKDLETAYSIKFIHFTVEEMGLVGSTHYVENTVVPQNLDIRLVLNIDEVGGVAGEVNNTVTCERDEWSPNGNNEASAAFTDTLAALTELYSTLNASISYAYGSDYVPFMDNGFVVTGYYEYNESPYPHTINDSLSNLDPDYVFELSKASLAAAMYFSGAADLTSGGDFPDAEAIGFSVEPNPFRGTLRVKNNGAVNARFEVLDLHGNVTIANELLPHSTLNLRADLPHGIYFYRILYNGEPLQTGKLISR